MITAMALQRTISSVAFDKLDLYIFLSVMPKWSFQIFGQLNVPNISNIQDLNCARALLRTA